MPFGGKNMKAKGIISVLLAFVLITALLPTAVSAAPEAHCSHDSQDDDGCLLHNGWTAIATKEQLDDLARNGGSGFLTQDINISEEIKINSNVELCLNGYSIIQTNVDTNIKHSVLKIEENKTLTLYDKSDNSGKITHGANAPGPGVKVSGTFVMEGGEISGNSNPKEYGGGVYIWYGSFTMNGGTISGNSGHFGGGVCNFNGSFTMNGGTISDNTTESYGGGVYLQEATSNMYGGEISGNTADHSGGGVYVQYTSFNMYGGEITENTAKYHGGGICMGGPVHMSGGEISGNTAPGSDGIYYALDDSVPSTFTGGYLLDSIGAFSSKFPPPFCSVTFYANDGSENKVVQYLIADTDMLLAPNSFTHGSAYPFEGWNTDPKGNGTSYSDNGAININSDISLYAQWHTDPATAPTFTAQPGDAALTYGYTAGATLTVGASAADGHTVSKYQWYSCDDASGTNPKPVDGATDASYTVPTGLAAGNHYYCCYVTAKRTDNSNTQTAVSNTATVTVGKKALTVTVKDQEYVFNGSGQGDDNTYSDPAKISEKVEVEGLLDGDALDVISLSGNKTDAGIYHGLIEPKDAMVIDAGGKNVTGNYDITYVAGKLTILKATPDCALPGNLTAVYGQTLADVELPDGWTWNDPVATKVGNTGKNTFQAIFTPADNLNYKTVTETLTVTVTKAAAPSAAALTDGEKPKTVENLIGEPFEQALVTAPEKLPEGYTGVEYSTDGENWSDKIPTGKEAGTYTVQVKYIGDGNHTDFTADPVTVTVEKAVYAFSPDGEETPTYTKGSRNELTLTFTQTGANDTSFEHFAGVRIGQTELKKDADYTARKGSTVVTILPAALDRLAVGNHTLTVRFTNGEASTQFSVLAADSGDSVSPQTGDSGPNALLIFLMFASATAALLFIIGKRKRAFGK